MAKALTTSEANKHLMELGFHRCNIIEDNDFTKDFGKTSYSIEESTNMFDKEKKYRWWNIVSGSVRFLLNINEYHNGRSYLGISKIVYNEIGSSGKQIVNYAKLKASDKKRFIEIFDELATRKQSYTLPNTNTSGVYEVYGDALPEKIIEF